MSTRQAKCELGHSHTIDVCDSCKSDLPRDHYQVILRRSSSAVGLSYCVACAATSPLAKYFLLLPGFNHDEIYDALKMPRDPRRDSY